MGAVLFACPYNRQERTRVVTTVQEIKKLRDKTGAGVLDCREALTNCEGDYDRALKVLRAKGAAVTEKRAGRAADEGFLATYDHAGRVGVLVEMRCETDFVSESRGFRELAHEVALQVAAQKPRWISRDEVPTEVIKGLIAEESANAAALGKSEQITERIVAGKIERFYRDNCLLEQPYIRNDQETIGDLVQDKIVAFNEKLFVHRFMRYELGE
jgi:elongation factor Ts